ncbi:hypothetical protein BDR07DRAFT_1376462 [Suillus spraguei]|nr:hypothetical protein BDR07DRAFT_1376462 [Suillus spraguei]
MDDSAINGGVTAASSCAHDMDQGTREGSQISSNRYVHWAGNDSRRLTKTVMYSYSAPALTLHQRNPYNQMEASTPRIAGIETDEEKVTAAHTPIGRVPWLQRVYAKIKPTIFLNSPSARAKNRDAKTDDTKSFKNSSQNSREATESAFLFSQERASVGSLNNSGAEVHWQDGWVRAELQY